MLEQLELPEDDSLTQIGAMLEAGKEMMLDFRVSQQDGARFFIRLSGLRDGLLFALSVSDIKDKHNLIQPGNDVVALGKTNNGDLDRNEQSNVLVGPFGIQTLTNREFDIGAVPFDFVMKSVENGVKTTSPMGLSKNDDDLAWRPDINGCSAVGVVGVSEFKTKVEVKSDLTIDNSDKDKLRRIVSTSKNYNFEKCGNVPYFAVKKSRCCFPCCCPCLGWPLLKCQVRYRVTSTDPGSS